MQSYLHIQMDSNSLQLIINKVIHKYSYFDVREIIPIDEKIKAILRNLTTDLIGLRNEMRSCALQGCDHCHYNLSRAKIIQTDIDFLTNIQQ
jgi:hypothetical protein